MKQVMIWVSMQAQHPVTVRLFVSKQVMKIHQHRLVRLSRYLFSLDIRLQKDCLLHRLFMPQMERLAMF